MYLNNNPLVSVIVPVYNVEQYIERCIESILLSTYKNFEIILINDGSTDNTALILNKYNSNKQCKVIHTINGGQSKSRNIGLKESKGEYIYFVDSDDFIANNAIEIMMKNIMYHDADICCARANFIDHNNKIEKEIPLYNRVKIDNHQEIIASALLIELIKVALWIKIFRRSVIEDNNILFYEDIMNEDYLFSVQTALKSKTVIFCNDIIYHVTIRENSVSRTIKKESITDFDIIYNQLYKEFKNNIINQNLLNIGYIKSIIFSLLNNVNRINSYKEFRDIYKNINWDLYGNKLHVIYKYNMILTLLYCISFKSYLFYFISKIIVKVKNFN